MAQGRKNIGTYRGTLDVSSQLKPVPFDDGATDYVPPSAPERRVRPVPIRSDPTKRGPRIDPTQRGEIRLSRRIANLTKRGRSFQVVTVYRARKGIVYPIRKAIADKMTIPKDLANDSPKEKNGKITPDFESKPTQQTTNASAANPEPNEAGFLSGNMLVWLGIGVVAFLLFRGK